MKSYLALIQNDIRLAFRQKVVVFFNYVIPLLFFFIFAQSSHAERGAAILEVFTMVTVIGILGNGMMGAGMRTVQDREANILRRFKVTPIGPLPVLVASMVTGLVVYIPFVILMLAVSQNRYGMRLPDHLAQVMIFIALGVIAIRSVGLILASVVNSMPEAQVLVQIAYMSMLFLSGATFPLALMPDWLFNVTQFIPSTYLVNGLQGIMIRNESLVDNWQATGALALTAVIGLLLSVKLFRWEKEEKIRPAARLWVLAVVLPFIVLGSYQSYAKENSAKAKILARDLARARTRLIRNARIFTGDGKVIENGAVLVKDGKIAEVYDGNIPDPKAVNAETVEAAGETLLPGLVDTRVHLTPDQKDMERELGAYLYCGVTAVRSFADPPDIAEKVAALVNSGQVQGAEFFVGSQLTPAPVLGWAEASPALLNRSLVQQVVPKETLAAAKGAKPLTNMEIQKAALLQEYRSGAMLVVGSGAGQAMVFHGPGIQRELQLWVDAGIPANVALQAATLNGAKELHAESRFGSISKGKDANLMMVDGNPLQDIRALEAISLVMFKGERVERGRLLKAEE